MCCGCGSTAVKQDLLMLNEEVGKNTTGKTFKRSYASTFFKITVFVGVLLGLIGALFLISQFLPHAGSLTTFLQKVSAFITHIATKLGTDARSLSIFVTAVGGTIFFVGTTGWIAESCIHKERQIRRSDLQERIKEDKKEEGKTPQNANTQNSNNAN